MSCGGGGGGVIESLIISGSKSEGTCNFTYFVRKVRLSLKANVHLFIFRYGTGQERERKTWVDFHLKIIPQKKFLSDNLIDRSILKPLHCAWKPNCYVVVLNCFEFLIDNQKNTKFELVNFEWKFSFSCDVIGKSWSRFNFFGKENFPARKTKYLNAHAHVTTFPFPFLSHTGKQVSGN